MIKKEVVSSHYYLDDMHTLQLETTVLHEGRQHHVVLKSMASEATTPGFNSWLSPVLTM